MQKVILTKGLPGSGKSTWAIQYVKDHPDYKRINNDDLRRMFIGKNFGSDKQEKFISKIRNELIISCLLSGFSVIIDNTNLNIKRIEQIEQLVDDFNIEHNLSFEKIVRVEIKDFTNIPLEECIKNDLNRLHSVGKDVIMQMYNQYLYKEPEKLIQDENLPRAIICDLDGTLTLLNGRNPYDASTCENDLINAPILKILLELQNCHIIFCSGREDKYREQTMKFIEKCDPLFEKPIINSRFGEGDKEIQNGLFSLHMRKTGDFRKDAIIKEEIYNEHIKGKYFVEFVLDDRLQVCRMWHKLGLPLLRVGDPDASF